MLDAEQARKMSDNYWTEEAKEERKRRAYERELNRILKKIEEAAKNGNRKVCIKDPHISRAVSRKLESLGFKLIDTTRYPIEAGSGFETTIIW